MHVLEAYQALIRWRREAFLSSHFLGPPGVQSLGLYSSLFVFSLPSTPDFPRFSMSSLYSQASPGALLYFGMTNQLRGLAYTNDITPEDALKQGNHAQMVVDSAFCCLLSPASLTSDDP